MSDHRSPVTAVSAWAAFSLRYGIAPTSIRWMQSDTEYWIKKEAEAGVEWKIIRVEIRKIDP
jgi:hypothetical protein